MLLIVLVGVVVCDGMLLGKNILELKKAMAELQSCVDKTDEACIRRSSPGVLRALSPFTKKSTVYLGIDMEEGSVSLVGGKTKTVTDEGIKIPLNNLGGWMVDYPQVDLMETGVNVAYVDAPWALLEKIPEGFTMGLEIATPLPGHTFVVRFDTRSREMWLKDPSTFSCERAKQYERDLMEDSKRARRLKVLMLVPKNLACPDFPMDVVTLEGRQQKGPGGGEMKIFLSQVVSDTGLYPYDLQYKDASNLAKYVIPPTDFRWGFGTSKEKKVEDAVDDKDDEVLPQFRNKKGDKAKKVEDAVFQPRGEL